MLVTPVLDKESGKGLNKPMWLQMIRMKGMVPLCGISAVPPDKVVRTGRCTDVRATKSSRVKSWKTRTDMCQLVRKVDREIHKSWGSP